MSECSTDSTNVHSVPHSCSLGISVIIPTLNRGELIAVSAVGLLAQLTENDELIIVDQTDTPSEEVRTLYRQLLTNGRVSDNPDSDNPDSDNPVSDNPVSDNPVSDNPVRIIYSSYKSSGQARNTGAWFARKDILLFWDDDLKPDDGVLERHRRYYQSPYTDDQSIVGVAGCYAGNYIVSPKGKRYAWNFAAGHVSFLRKAFFEVGGFNRNFIYPFIPEDQELHIRLAGRGYHLIPGRDCSGYHAASAGLSYSSHQTDAWYKGVVHNLFYGVWHTLWYRRFSPAGVLAAGHLLYTLFRYMFPVKLFAYRSLRILFWQQVFKSWRTFRRTTITVELPQDAEIIDWELKFPHESQP